VSAAPSRDSLDAEEYIAFARWVVRRHVADVVVAGRINGRLSMAERRLRDPRLYVAVVGETSTGKSTFLNALLRDRVLLASALATTAVTTRILSGSSPRLRFFLRSEREEYVLPAPDPDGQVRLAGAFDRIARGTQYPPTFAEAVALLTADTTVSRRVTALWLEHPAPSLDAGLVVIDTPGSNADVVHHVEATRKVMADEADLAVVTVRADVPVPKSLLDFLTAALTPEQLSRCVFLATRMDEIRPREAEQRVRAVSSQLAAGLGVEQVTVWPVAALRALEYAEDPKQFSAHRSWADGFTRVERDLLGFARAHREALVADGVLRIIDQAIGELGVALGRRAAELIAVSERLVDLPIRDVDAFAAEVRRSARRELDAAFGAVESALMTAVKEARASFAAGARTELAGANTQDSLDRAMRERIPELLRDVIERLETQVGEVVATEGGEVLGRIVAGAERRFTAEYRRFVGVVGAGAEVSTQTGATAVGLVSFDGRDSLSLVVGADRTQRTGRAVVGAASGAAIGSLLLPGAGTVIGAGIGAVAGRMFRNGVGEVRARYQEEVDRLSGQVFADLGHSVHAALPELSARHQAVLGESCHDLAARYGPLVAKALREHTVERERVGAELTALATDHRVTDARREVLTEQRRQLAVAFAR
jgi:GTP-binding protein EngB required for normal cell division